ncbi:MAG: cyclic nucleotide-binding domain-containing protein, partial [Candidatus Binatia bacterium]
QAAGAGSDGLSGEWLSMEQVSQLEFFKSGKRAFKVKLSSNFAPTAGQAEPGIKAVVRREYQAGDVICKAGAYGSTAFLILEGTATASVPEQAEGVPIVARTRGALARFADLFGRRTQAQRSTPPGVEAFGEVSPYASLNADPPPPVTLGPGDFFGIDACINFYPREVSVRAEERCVVLEMLRSVLDTIRDAGDASGRIDEAYRAGAVRNQLALATWLGGIGVAPRERLAAGAALLTADADEIRDAVIYREGEPSDAVYLVRAGTIKITQQRPDGELILAYLGRGATFGLESVLIDRPPAPLRLLCTSHPTIGAVALGGSVTIGRGPSADLHLPSDDRTISKRHCRLDLRDGEIFLTDLDSANFTLLNGERIREAIVAVGDRITLVDYTFAVERQATEATLVGPSPRRATAAGLDNFEIVKLDGRELRHLAGQDPGLRRALEAVARTVESAVPAPVAPDPTVLRELVDLNLYNAQNTLLIDLDRCTRCDECVRACADAHGGVSRFTRDGPRFGKYLVTMACRSCTDPKCMIGCPVGSIRREESLQIVIEPWCIGCQRCANQCPFGNINMVELAAPAPGSAADPPLRATVCDLCAGYDGPNCVYACPHDAAIRVNPAAFLSGGDLR